MKKNTSKSTKKYSQLNLEEREEIAVYLEIGLKQCEIALKLQHSLPALVLLRKPLFGLANRHIQPERYAK
jgi:hypothetical protein